MPVTPIAVQRILNRTEGSGAKLWSHPIWSGLSDGPLMSLDFGPHLFESQADPADGDTLVDMARFQDAEFVIPSGNTPRFVGGGIEWSGLANVALQGITGIDALGARCADLQADQYFMLMAYIRLPSETAWPLAAGNFTPIIDMTEAGNSNNYTNSASLVVFGPNPNATNRRIAFARQEAIGSTTTRYVTFGSGQYVAGELAQVGFFRTATELRCWVRTPTAGLLTNITSGATPANTEDLSLVVGKIGPRTSYANQADSTVRSLYAGTRHYGYHLENLAATGRDPAVVADNDWDFMLTRIAAGDIDLDAV